MFSPEELDECICEESGNEKVNDIYLIDQELKKDTANQRVVKSESWIRDEVHEET